MSYPSATWQLRSSTIGAQPIAETSDTARHLVGQRVKAHHYTYGEGEFVYLPGVASTAAGDLVAYDSKTGFTERAVIGKRGPLAVAMSACTAGLYGWYAVFGAVPVNTSTFQPSLGQSYLSDTAGAVSGVATEGQRLDGFALRSMPSGGFATAQLHQPAANGGDLTADYKRGRA